MNVQTLQVTFYIIGIIYMTLQVLFFLIIIILLFYIKTKITKVANTIEQRIELVKNVVKHPGGIAATIGTAVAATAISKVTNMIKSKKKNE